jgi:hypothetical protein
MRTVGDAAPSCFRNHAKFDDGSDHFIALRSERYWCCVLSYAECDIRELFTRKRPCSHIHVGCIEQTKMLHKNAINASSTKRAILIVWVRLTALTWLPVGPFRVLGWYFQLWAAVAVAQILKIL